MLEAIKARRSLGGYDSLLPLAHISQMRLFMLRQGIEWFAKQDSFNQRRKFLAKVVRFNHLATRLPAIVDCFLIDGKGLLFFRPVKDTYRVMFFTKTQYRVYYDENGDIEELWISYKFRTRRNTNFATVLGTAPGFAPSSLPSEPEERVFTMVVRQDVIFQQYSQTQQPFDSALGPTVLPGSWQRIINSLGFIPAVEVFNERGLEDGSSSGEFDTVEPFIDAHEKLSRNIRRNLNFYGNPTLVSSRPKTDLLERDDDSRGRNTVAANSGFRQAPISSSDDDQLSEPENGIHVPRVIANVEAADRVGYITPDGVSGDQIQYEQRYMEAIRSVLGGVDDLSISAGATAYEVKTMFGRVAATATRKCTALFDFGFASLFSMMITHEEELFRLSLGQALGMPQPVPPDLRPYPDQVRAQVKASYDAMVGNWTQIIEQCIAKIRESGEAPPGLTGLIPDGDTTVSWRHTGQVFEDSAQDTLQNSIVCRNLQELGVGSIEALTHLFPSKTPEEIAAMLSGYPFRQAEATQRSVGIYVDLLRSMLQTPHPQKPDLPLAADPGLDLTPYLYRTLDYLRQELSYTGTHSDVDVAQQPPTISGTDRRLAQLGERTDADRQRDQFRSILASELARGALSTRGSVPGGPGGLSISDADAPVPGMGGTLVWDPAAAYPGAGLELGQPGFSPFAGAPVQPGGPGAAGPGGPGGQPADRGAAAAGRDGRRGPGAAATGPDRRVPKRSK